VRNFLPSTEESPERPADPALRQANLRRIGALFAPYRLRLWGLLLLIVASAALGVVPAFLLKSVLEAISRNDTAALSLATGGMIAIAVASGVLGVIQTLLSNQVGQRVMHDLRAAFFRHLQRLSLAFSRAPAPVRSSRGSRTTSAASRTWSRTPPRRSRRM
jgi:ATP-binding cassette, subfamily B, bacterial